MPRPSSTNLTISRPYCVVEVDPLVPVPVIVPVQVVPVPLVVPVLPVVVEPVVPVVPVVVPDVVPVVDPFWVASPVFSAVDCLLSHAASGPATARSTIASSDSRCNVASLAKTSLLDIGPHRKSTRTAPRSSAIPVP